MPVLRFQTAALHAKFLQDLRSEGLERTIDSAETVRCSEDEWPKVNAIAHRIRDSCFPWYFSWLETAEAAREFEAYLQDNGFRFELEQHEDRLVFLLPKEDEKRYSYGATPPANLDCSFCGKRHTEVKRFFASESAAICDECIAVFAGSS